ncbi:MAG: PAS domain S-box protein [Chlorogloeopsis fritschii C42_A2020_084]|uniref:PAS domain S-box protein n=1 Tax=Chlorogloeopsis fritschii TaxID=1124 RepID=UPI001A099802|nr:PAS domain S-box protein [Chlorogloeopsis fritschii]MBF2003892.1 PAS domain S-box protein [Chlorogloeopsis fritschii C42_A2020_084]
MKLSITQKLAVGFATALAVVVGNAIVSYWNTLQLIDNERWVQHTHKVLTQLESTLSTLEDAENGQRGYLITGDTSYLESYFDTDGEINENLKKLRELTADNPNQQERISLLEQKIIKRLELLQQGLSLRQQQGFAPAQELVMSGRGKRVMDEIRQIIKEMQQAENSLLEKRSQLSQASSQQTIATFTLAAILNFALIVALYIFIRRYISQNQKSQQALKNSEQQFRATFNQVAVGIAHIAPNGKWLLVNEKICEIVGYSREELLNLTFQDITHPEDLNTDLEYVRQILANKIQTYSMEKRYIRKDGDRIWVNLTVSLVRESSGEPKYFISVVEDITKRKQAEQALQESLKDLADMKFALDQAAIVAFTDDKGKITYINDKFCEISQYSREELLGQNHRIINSGYHPREFFQQMWATITKGLVWRGEIKNRAKDGTFYWVDTTIVPLLDAQGKPFEYVAIHSDITQRKAAQEKIQEQAQLLDQSQDGIFVIDMAECIVYWNKSAESLFGWTNAEAIAKKASELVFKNTSPQLQEVQETIAQSGTWQGELYLVKKDGKEIIVDSGWTLVRNDKQEPKSILIVNTDITEKKKLEAQFLRAQRLESIGTLAGGIAHDLNNVLAPVLMSVQLLRMKFPEPQNQQLLTLMEDSVKRGANLVKQVLSFARGLSGDRTILQLKHIIREIEQIIKETFPKSIELQTDLPKDLWTVYGDATQIHQVLMNLVVNANDAMPKVGVLKIVAENVVLDEQYAKMHIDAQAGTYTVITVEDTGIGMPPEVQERIFEPFFTTKEVSKGTGLGLSTVIGIVKNHGGFVNVYSEVGKGTKFQIYFPASEGNETQQSAQQREELTGNGELILVVDDEVTIREITKSSLEAYNYRVITASDGVEAVTIYAQQWQEISIVLLDMMMPAMDGAIAIRTLEKINPDVKIIATSGLLSQQTIAESQGTGVKAFLSKPCTAKELLLAISAVNKRVQGTGD